MLKQFSNLKERKGMQKKIMQNKTMQIKPNLNFKTGNATCCNNRDDLPDISFTLKI